MFDKVLIANRAEIAVRIARTCRGLGIATVAVHSDVDARARHVAAADEAVRLPGVASTQTYLNAAGLIEAAVTTGAQAVHPGYGFLAESARFARAVADAGLVWIGPPPDVLEAVGDKIKARAIASAAGVAVIPGMTHAATGPPEVARFATDHGYPVALKAAAGGGGRGLKVARAPGDLEGAFAAARREAVAYFGSGDLYAERYLDRPKHLEVQVLAPGPGDALWLGVRDCSLQRRHQKLVEETPPPLWSERADDMGRAAVALCKACGYVNAGTVEMLVDTSGDFYFLEVNARLQVEHTVTEEVFGVDLVACQLLIAAGEPLGFSQGDLHARGHAIECRVNAEDPRRGFAPAPGVIARYRTPAGPGVRVDSGYGAGDEVPSAYDSLIAKVVTYGATREQARRRMLRALDEFEIAGVVTTIPAARSLLEAPEFVAGAHTVATVAQALPAAASPAPEGSVPDVDGRPVRLWHPAMKRSSAAAPGGTSSGAVAAPMHGTVLQVLVAAGQTVSAGQPLVVLETMKMETTVASGRDGVVAEMRAVPGRAVAAGEVLAVVA